jgi:hypothetical protein
MMAAAAAVLLVFLSISTVASSDDTNSVEEPRMPSRMATDRLVRAARRQAAAAQRQAAAAARRGGGGGAPRTQAGCRCLDRWNFGGLERSGCGNPNRDPLGYWCAVDETQCASYYGTFPVGGAAAEGGVDGAPASDAADPSTDRATPTMLAYDYCQGTDATGAFWPGPRERTKRGCLCQAGQWTLAGVSDADAASSSSSSSSSTTKVAPRALGPNVPAGKPHYHDRCAAPADGVTRQCVVDLRTCPNQRAFSSGGQDPIDSCAPLDAADAEKRGDAETAAAAKEHDAARRYFASLPAEQHRTLTGCGCDPNGWRYQFADGSFSDLIQGCANPDGDPLGPWCAVDPVKCAWFAGEMRLQPAAVAEGDSEDGEYDEDASSSSTKSNSDDRPSAIAYDYCKVSAEEAAAKDEPLASRLSEKAMFLARAARESAARTADLLSKQRAFVKEHILGGADPSSMATAAENTSPPPPRTLEGWGLPASACRLGQLPAWSQCGGKSSCSGWGCLDGAWSGQCCSPGTVCERQHSFFWQCVPPETALSYGGEADACDPDARRRAAAAEAAALALGEDGTEAERRAATKSPFPPPVVLDGVGTQCGGMADCPDAVKGTDSCGDRPWPGFCCPEGSVCRRQPGNPWFWGCEDAALAASASGGSASASGTLPDALEGPSSAGGAADGAETLTSFALGGAGGDDPVRAADLVFTPEMGAAQAPESSGLTAGRGFVMRMKVDGDYDKLMGWGPGGQGEGVVRGAASGGGGGSGPLAGVVGALVGVEAGPLLPAGEAGGVAASAPSPQAQNIPDTPALREFRAGIVQAVAAAAAAPPGTLFRIDVASVSSGSIVADVGVTFAAQAAEADVAAAFSRLREGAGDAYASVGEGALPTAFGKLVSVAISAEHGGGAPLTSASFMGGGSGDWDSSSSSFSDRVGSSVRGGHGARAGPGVDADVAFGKRKTVGVLGSDALAGIAVGCVVAAVAAAFAVQRGVAARRAQGKDADKAAQLRYLAEANEGEVARELAAEGRLAPEEVIGGRELLESAREERERRRHAGAAGGSAGGGRRSSSGGGAAAAADLAEEGQAALANGAQPWAQKWLAKLEEQAQAVLLRSPPRSPSRAAAARRGGDDAFGGGGGGHHTLTSHAVKVTGAGAAEAAFLSRAPSDAGAAAYTTAAAPGPSAAQQRRASKSGGGGGGEQ